MKNMKFWRTALVATLVLTVMLSVTGGTIAWFTDSVTSEVNTIQAGNLDVELYHSNKNTATETKVEAATKLFETPTLWEPGAAAWENLKVMNAGDLGLIYEMTINAAGENTFKGHKLSEVLKVGIVKGGIAADAKRADVLAQVTDGWKSFSEYKVEGKILPANSNLTVEGASVGDETYGVVIYWKPTANDNDWNVNNGQKTDDDKEYLTIDLGVNLTATQLMAESDSFGTDYDENAKYGVAAEELRDLLAVGGDVVVEGIVNADENQIIEEWDQTAEYQVDSSQVSSLTGGELILDNDAKYGLVVFGEDNNVSISDTTIEANSQWSVLVSTDNGKTTTFNNVEVNAEKGAGIYAYGNGKAELNNVQVNHKALDEQYASSTPWAATAVAAAEGVDVTINSGTYVGSKWALFVYSSGATVTINDGTFKAPVVVAADAQNGAKAYIVINGGNFDGRFESVNVWGTGSEALITLNGGNFTNFSTTAGGRITIKGGTFDTNPTPWLADGYVATANEDGTWTVSAE